MCCEKYHFSQLQLKYLNETVIDYVMALWHLMLPNIYSITSEYLLIQGSVSLSMPGNKADLKVKQMCND